jgi:hypothetical protein
LNKSSNGLTVVFQGADKAACQVPIVELAKRGALSKVRWTTAAAAVSP